MNAAAADPATLSTIPAPAMAPDPQAAYEAARAAAIEAGDLKLANAYYMVADLLRELADERAETARLRALLAGRSQ